MKNLFHSEAEKGNTRFVWQNASAKQNPALEPTLEEIAAAFTALEAPDYATIDDKNIVTARAAYELANGMEKANAEQQAKLPAFAEKLKVAERAVAVASYQKEMAELQNTTAKDFLSQMTINPETLSMEELGFVNDFLKTMSDNITNFDTYVTAGADTGPFLKQFSENMKDSVESGKMDYQQFSSQFKVDFEKFLGEQQTNAENKEILSFDLERVMSRLNNIGSVVDAIDGKLNARVTADADKTPPGSFKEGTPQYNEAARTMLIAELTQKVKAELHEWVKLNTPVLDSIKDKERDVKMKKLLPGKKSQVGNVVQTGLDAVGGVLKSEYGDIQYFKPDSILRQVFADQEVAMVQSYLTNGTDMLNDKDLNIEGSIEAWLEVMVPVGTPFESIKEKFHVLKMDPTLEGGKEDIEVLIEKMKTVSREYVGGEWEVKYESYVKGTGKEALDFGEWIDMQEVSAWDRIMLLFRKFFTNENGEFDMLAFTKKKAEGDINERDSIARLTALREGIEVEEDEDPVDALKSVEKREGLLKKIEDKPDYFTFSPGKKDNNAQAKAYIEGMTNMEDLRSLEYVFGQAGKEIESMPFGVALTQGLSIETLIKMKNKRGTVSVRKNKKGDAWELLLSETNKGKDTDVVEWDNKKIQDTLDGLIDFPDLELGMESLEISLGGYSRDGGNFNDKLKEFRKGGTFEGKEKELFEVLHDSKVQHFIKQLNKTGVQKHLGNNVLNIKTFSGKLTLDLLKQIKEYDRNLNFAGNNASSEGGKVKVNPNTKWGRGDLKVELDTGLWIDFDEFTELSYILENSTELSGTINDYNEQRKEIEKESAKDTKDESKDEKTPKDVTVLPGINGVPIVF